MGTSFGVNVHSIDVADYSAAAAIHDSDCCWTIDVVVRRIDRQSSIHSTECAL